MLARTLADQTCTTDGLSVEYAAPEQFDPDSFGDPDMLTDVYQVGALVYALVTGQPPHTGTQLNIVNDMLTESPPAPSSEHRGDVPEAVDQNILRALECEKNNRYRAVGMFLEDLVTIRADVPFGQREMSRGSDRKDSIAVGNEPPLSKGTSAANNRGTERDDTPSGDSREVTADDEVRDVDEDRFQPGDFVRIAYTARTVEDGALVDTTDPEIADEEGVEDQPKEFSPRTITLGEGHVFEAVVEALADSVPGDSGCVTVPAEGAFGTYDPDDVETMKTKKIEEKTRYPGASVHIKGR